MITGLYHLHKVERILENGKSTDFCLIETSSNNFKHIEIYSIHLDPEKVSNEDEMIEKFLTQRINKKIADKSKDIPERDFFLIPILHGRIESLLTYGNYFQKKKLNLYGVTEPLSFMTFSNPGGDWTHRFGRVSKLFYSEEVEEYETNASYIDGV